MKVKILATRCRYCHHDFSEAEMREGYVGQVIMTGSLLLFLGFMVHECSAPPPATVAVEQPTQVMSPDDELMQARRELLYTNGMKSSVDGDTVTVSVSEANWPCIALARRKKLTHWYQLVEAAGTTRRPTDIAVRFVGARHHRPLSIDAKEIC